MHGAGNGLETDPTRMASQKTKSMMPPPAAVSQHTYLILRNVLELLIEGHMLDCRWAMQARKICLRQDSRFGVAHDHKASLGVQ